MRPLTVLLLASLFWMPLRAQDSVDVTFRYSIAGQTGVSVPGEFNGWNNTAWPMTNIGGNLYVRTARLRLGGNPSPPAFGVPGAWQYKFYYNGAGQWPNDPLNHHVNARDNSNSFIIVKDPTIYQVLPNDRSPLIYTSFPTMSAYLFPKVGSVVDTSRISLTIDGTPFPGLGPYYNFTTKQFVYSHPSALPNGTHTVILSAGDNADTVTFTTRGGFVQIQNQSPFTTGKSIWTINGTVEDSAVSSVRIVRNGTDTIPVSVANMSFSADVPLVEGANVLIALADSAGISTASLPVTFVRRVNHTPWGVIALLGTSGGITLGANGSSDPDSGQAANLTYRWTADPGNPSPVSGVDGSTSDQVTFPVPAVAGEYSFRLIVTDPQGNTDTTRNYVTVNPDFSVQAPAIFSNPEWAKRARIYFLFPKGASPSGTLNAAALRLQSIKDLGFSVIWLMPVMKNAFPIDNNYGTGYNIVDFYTVAPEYGTNQDLKNFVAQAHALGLKVILDITPNHSSRFHPWSVDAHTFKGNSPYWNWYQHQYIPHDENGLGQAADADGFWYYGGFSDQLLNLNWKDIDLQAEMVKVFSYWVKYFDIDGYRFDVYWGPHRRYGEQYMGKPVREALKHIKPDILLLGEDSGTGGGTESIFADYTVSGVRGGVDAAYDFNLYFNEIRNFGFGNAAIQGLHDAIDNAGFYPGPNALYMRFMESQDEDRIVYYYSNGFAIDSAIAFKRTMPVASVLFTCPGVPMLWNGQEVGWGYGIQGSKEARARGVINWNYAGKSLLSPHYQRLANIRGQFRAFTQHKQDTNHDGFVTSLDQSEFVRVAAPSGVYAFSRPFPDQTGLTVVNVSAIGTTALLDLTASGVLSFTGGINPASNYYLNDLMTNTRQQLLGSELNAVSVPLGGYGSALFTVSTTEDSVTITNPVVDAGTVSDNLAPEAYLLSQNYPNPFNPVTTIEYSLPKQEAVTIRVFNLLGAEVATLARGVQPPGRHRVDWNAGNLPSGVYFYQLSTPSFVSVKKMLLLR